MSVVIITLRITIVSRKTSSLEEVITLVPWLIKKTVDSLARMVKTQSSVILLDQFMEMLIRSMEDQKTIH